MTLSDLDERKDRIEYESMFSSICALSIHIYVYIYICVCVEFLNRSKTFAVASFSAF